MTSNYERFVGFKSLKMDPKFRISIQTNWRPDDGTPLYLMLSANHGMDFVKVLSKEAYQEKVALVQNSPKSPAEKSDILGRLALFCREASINDQGKLLIPKELSEKAGIAAESEVMLAGRGIHFEIWCKTNFDRLLEIEKPTRDDKDDLGIF